MSYQLNHQQIAWRVAQDLVRASHVVLGTGMPMLVAKHMPSGCELRIPREEGAEHTSQLPSHEFESPFSRDSASIDTLVLGAHQVAENGDLAGWELPKALGDDPESLADSDRKVLVMMEYFNKEGDCNIVPACTLPVTALRCVTSIYTDIAVIDIIKGRVIIRELIEGITLHTLQMETPVQLEVSSQLQLLQAPVLG